MIKRINLQGIAGFALVAALAVMQGWTLPDFCWSNWLAGLLYGWCCIVVAVAQIVLSEALRKEHGVKKNLLLQSMPPLVRVVAVSVACFFVAFLAYELYSLFFIYLGIGVSLFFGDGPLNPLNPLNMEDTSIAFDTVAYLLEDFWPVAAGMILTRWPDFVRGNPWKRIFLPLDKKLIHTHALILGGMLCAVIAQLFFAETYETVAIVIILGGMFLWPQNTGEPGGKKADDSKPDEPLETQRQPSGNLANTQETNSQLDGGVSLVSTKAAEKISSDDTFIYKKILPGVWAGLWTFFVLLTFFLQLSAAAWMYAAIAAAVLISFLLYKNTLSDLADEVVNEGEALFIRNGKQSIRLNIGAIRQAEYFPQSTPERVTLYLIDRSAIGEKISFVPRQADHPPQPHRKVADLISEIHSNAIRPPR